MFQISVAFEIIMLSKFQQRRSLQFAPKHHAANFQLLLLKWNTRVTNKNESHLTSEIDFSERSLSCDTASVRHG